MTVLKTKLFSLGALVVSWCVLPVAGAQEGAQALGWVDNTQGLCQGYFTPGGEMVDLSEVEGTDITGQRGTLAPQGDSWLEQGLMRSGRLSLQGQKFRVNKEELVAEGEVELVTDELLLLATSGVFYPETSMCSVDHAMYRLSAPGKSRTGYIWGSAAAVEGKQGGQWQFKDVTYSPCSPQHPWWSLHAEEMVLNQESQEARLKKLWLKVGEVPVLYLPYMEFMTGENVRKTGFLTPHFGHSSSSGFMFSLPFYWNIAPNIDMLLRSSWLEKRGLALRDRWRWLMMQGQMEHDVILLPDDRKYKSNQAINPMQRAWRYAWHGTWQREGVINQSVAIHKVSDDYLLTDLNDPWHAVDALYLDNSYQAEISRRGWDAHLLMLAYQNLHPIDQAVSRNQFDRLPEIEWQFHPSNYGGNHYPTLSVLASRFRVRDDDFTTEDMVEGDRLVTEMKVQSYLHSQYWQPEVQWGWLSTTDKPVGEHHVSVVQPFITIAQQRPWWQGASWLVEPGIYYRYLPRQHQAQTLPIYDTDQLPLSLQNLHAINRFVGYDRYGDSNDLLLQVANTWWLGGHSEQRLVWQAATVYAFDKHAVCIDPGCQSDPLAQRHWLDLASLLTFDGGQGWHVHSNFTYAHAKDPEYWDVGISREKNALTWSVNYTEQNHVYDQYAESYHLFRQLNTNMHWKINEKLDTMAEVSYDVRLKQPTVASLAVTHHSCCVDTSLRLTRSIMGLENERWIYNNALFFSVSLVGLGGVDWHYDWDRYHE